MRSRSTRRSQRPVSCSGRSRQRAASGAKPRLRLVERLQPIRAIRLRRFRVPPTAETETTDAKSIVRDEAHGANLPEELVANETAQPPTRGGLSIACVDAINELITVDDLAAIREYGIGRSALGARFVNPPAQPQSDHQNQQHRRSEAERKG